MSTLDKYGRNPNGYIEELAYGATGGDLARVAPIDRRIAINYNENFGSKRDPRSMEDNMNEVAYDLNNGQIPLSVPFNGRDGLHYDVKKVRIGDSHILVGHDNQGYPIVYDIPRDEPFLGHNTYFWLGQPEGEYWGKGRYNTGWYNHLDNLEDEYEYQKAIQEYMAAKGAY